MNRREIALSWWNELDEAKKQEYYNKYVTCNQLASAHNQLTGREIENIWIKINSEK